MMRNILLFLFLTSLAFKGFGQKEDRFSAKLSPAFNAMLLKKVSKDSLDLIVSYKNIEELKKRGRVLIEYKNARVSSVRVAPQMISLLVPDSNILFIDIQRKPKEELTTGAFDLSANRINVVHHLYPLINGDAIKLSIKEQRFDTADIDFKGRTFNSGLSAPTSSSHASIMATIIAGGSNSSSYSKGAAWGSYFTSSNFANLLPDPDSIFKNFNITVQNHSYGTGIENFYGNDAAAYDVSVYTNPVLMHVFSAGNSGNAAPTSGTYTGITGYSNITGSFKMSKNTIVVGHIDSFYNVLPLSSKGPAYDGRIKPEVVAFGEDGSSGAAAITSGVCALLQDAYFKKWNSLPSASLVKATLINSAQDIGAKGPDFTSGFGAVNAAAAMETLLQNRFFQSEIINNEVRSFSLVVPANSAQLKVTLTWTDTAAAPNAAKALVNDLDMVIKNASTGEEWLPWFLSFSPNKDSLTALAMRKRDTLNNVEQISIENLTAGIYIIEVKGRQVKTVKQSFAIAYQIDSLNTFAFTYPTSSDLPLAGDTSVIRWQSNITGDGTLEYATNNQDWKVLTRTADITKQYYKWATPDTINTFQLRMKMNGSGKTIYSDSFVVSKPLALQVGFNCTDSFLLFWNNQRVPAYQMYHLDKKFLEPIFTTIDSAHIFNKKQNTSLYYAVAPLVNGRPALRSYTINYTTQGVGCYLRTFFAINQNDRGVLSATLGTTYEVASVVFQKIGPSGIKNIHTVNDPSSINLLAVDSSLTQGLNKYQLVLTLKNGQVLYSPVETVYYFPNFPVIIYPNPAPQNSSIQLIVKDPFTYSIEIYDAMGKKIITKRLEGFTSSLEPFSLSKGIYFIKISTESGKLAVQKMVVQ